MTMVAWVASALAVTKPMTGVLPTAVALALSAVSEPELYTASRTETVPGTT
jgi:fructose-1-phosphate kinase PfkB-like protein